MSILVNNSLTASLEIELSGENDGNLYIIHKKMLEILHLKINLFALILM